MNIRPLDTNQFNPFWVSIICPKNYEGSQHKSHLKEWQQCLYGRKKIEMMNCTFQLENCKLRRLLHMWNLSSSPTHIEDCCKHAVANSLQCWWRGSKDFTRYATAKNRRKWNSNQNGSCAMPYFEMSKPVYLSKIQ